MSLLKNFLIENSDITSKESEVAVSSRFKDEKGNLLKFKIRPMTSDEFGKYQKACTTLNLAGKKRSTQFDSAKFNLMVVVNHTIDPNFKEADLIKQLGVQTPEQAVNKTLLAGEIVELANQITTMSGFDNDINDDIEEAKN